MVYVFGLFEFDAVAGELRKQGRPVPIEPQPARALGLLLSRSGEVVSREAMRDQVWGPGTHVDFERGLVYCIGQVRAALGDSGTSPRFVQTLPKRGYRLLVPVTIRDSDPPAPAPPVMFSRARRGWLIAAVAFLVLSLAAWTAWSRAVSRRPLIAVAVFDNETGDPSFDPLAAAAADSLVARLTALDDGRLGIIGNAASVREPRASRDPLRIRRETGAGYLILGQVQNDTEGVRMVAHLLRLDDNTHLWVTRVRRPRAGLAGIEDDIAARLEQAVRWHIIERRPDAPRSTP